MKIQETLKVKNSLGLHIRPAATIVKLLQGTKSKVFFTCKNETVNAKSIMSILMLAAKKNSSIKITVDGEDAKLVMEKIKDSFHNGFGEK